VLPPERTPCPSISAVPAARTSPVSRPSTDTAWESTRTSGARLEKTGAAASIPPKWGVSAGRATLGGNGETPSGAPQGVYAKGPSSQRQPRRGFAPGFLLVDQLGPGARVHDMPDLKVHLYLPRLLLGTRSIGPPHIEVVIACFLDDEARALEVRAQVIQEGEIAGS
jgi:hypothetical protein